MSRKTKRGNRENREKERRNRGKGERKEREKRERERERERKGVGVSCLNEHFFKTNTPHYLKQHQCTYLIPLPNIFFVQLNFPLQISAIFVQNRSWAQMMTA